MKTGRPILVVDDAEATVEVIRRNLEAVGYLVLTADGVPSALEVLRGRQVDLVITDVQMPRVSGLDLVRHVRENLSDTEVAVITGFPNVDGAITAMKNGATDYLTKPFTSEELLAAVATALRRVDVRRAERSSPDGGGSSYRGLLGESAPIRRVVEQISRAARSSASVLVTGESGTGKELVARAIHYESERAAAPFVPVNCGAIPQDLLESELFGHVRGSFTGAVESRAGFFLTADGGTVFLDEIAETSAAMQVKLLRVLQDGVVRMIGSSKSRQVDVRVIAATNKDLEQLVQAGAFRQDLYFRIHVIGIEAPRLAERGSDIALLARHFASKFSQELGRDTPRFSERALLALESYSWPGNVREMQNVVQRAVVMTDGPCVDVQDLPPQMRFAAHGGGSRLDLTLAQVEKEHIAAVLSSVGGNKSQAARILGIDRKTLRSRLDAGSAD